jgi:hypothetical protein
MLRVYIVGRDLPELFFVHHILDDLRNPNSVSSKIGDVKPTEE